MSEVTLEKIDIIKERSGVSYKEAKEALLATDGDVLEALIYIENNQSGVTETVFSSFEDFKQWIKEILEKGNINRIKVKKGSKVIMDIPVTAGVAVSLVSLFFRELLVLGVVTALVTKITVEITKADGSVEVVNSIIKNKADDVKNKMNDLASEVKEKMGDLSKDVKDKLDNSNKKVENDDENVYQYTVTFEDVEEATKEKKEEEKEEEEK
ncbi:DUF4342 domain-containing protein [Clostridium grantii]|uniref:DUF4342 domain-containing protein n=1 Tax=Clostridium grantii DSM 8605 TaxID=1121316 RepID=A0A1M5QCY9_9CLOT|nr:DUF4342 domain-containing protein [Clostridium grantii]SHH11780.1 protein of unknown function [Clostridium grantii DSM 8605]